MKVSKRPLPQRPQKGLKVVHSVQFQKKCSRLWSEVSSQKHTQKWLLPAWFIVITGNQNLGFFPISLLCDFFEVISITQMFSGSQCIYEMVIMTSAALVWLWIKKRNGIHSYKTHWEFQRFSFISRKIQTSEILIKAKVGQLKLPSGLWRLHNMS